MIAFSSPIYAEASLKRAPVRDVDVAVWLREDVDFFEYMVERGLEIELRLGLPVDIQVLNIAPITFQYIVYTRGLPIVVKDEGIHDMEVAKTLLMYSDLVILRKKTQRTCDTSLTTFTP